MGNVLLQVLKLRNGISLGYKSQVVRVVTHICVVAVSQKKCTKLNVVMGMGGGKNNVATFCQEIEVLNVNMHG
jgi:hypothetical protein